MKHHFYVPPDFDDFFDDINETIPHLPGFLSNCLTDFRENLQSIMGAVSLPFLMAQHSASSLHYQRISAAERIRALLIDKQEGESDNDLELRQERAAIERANEQMREFGKSDEGIDLISRDIADFLLTYASQSDGATTPPAKGSAELLRQGIVLIWTAFESTCRDIATSYLNLNPSFALKFAKDVDIKRRIDASKISVETLAKNDFDVRESLGEILFEGQDLSDLRTIKAIFKCFSDDQALRSDLDDQSLWRLSQMRHLIVHRGGRVDKKYLEKTGDSVPLNKQIEVTPAQLKEYLGAVRKTVLSITRALSAR